MVWASRTCLNEILSNVLMFGSISNWDQKGTFAPIWLIFNNFPQTCQRCNASVYPWPVIVSSFKSKSHKSVSSPGCSWLIFSIPRLYFTNFSDINVRSFSTSASFFLTYGSPMTKLGQLRQSDDRLTLVVGGNKTYVWRSYCIIVAIFSRCDFPGARSAWMDGCWMKQPSSRGHFLHRVPKVILLPENTNSKWHKSKAQQNIWRERIHGSFLPLHRKNKNTKIWFWKT